MKVWVRFMDWLVASFQLHWPVSAAQVALYLETRASEPCGKSMQLSILKTLIFMEHAAEIPLAVEQAARSQECYGGGHLDVGKCKGDGKEASEIAASIGDLSHGRGCDEYGAGQVCQKLRLVQTAEGMGRHDTLGVDFGTIKLDESGLVCTLKRTKTTGPETDYRRADDRRKGGGSRPCGRLP